MSDLPTTVCQCLGGSTHATPEGRLCDLCGGIVQDQPAPQTTGTLSVEALHDHVRQRIQERLNLGHLYEITSEEDGFEASCHPEAAASVWRVTWDAIREAGWRLVRAEMSEPQTTATDEFWGDIWWVSDGKGFRNATPGECAAEIKRLRGIIADIATATDCGMYFTARAAALKGFTNAD